MTKRKKLEVVAQAEEPGKEGLENIKAYQGKRNGNLIPFTKETAQAARLKGLRSRQAVKAKKEEFVNRVRVLNMVMHRLPVIDAELVIRMRIHMALQEQDFEDAARWARELLEFQRPKLARTEVVKDNDYDKLSIEDLKKLAREEGLIS